MTITPHQIPRTEYRKNDLPLITAEAGEVGVNFNTLESLEEVEEFIVALRSAAKAANLPENKASK